ncbi:MAG: transglycosylase SLT domain-containing protein [Woeseiaceae bacterium]|nr:transglycosylase SLT domain-containing protein [Woeseiaceae bacterium]
MRSLILWLFALTAGFACSQPLAAADIEQQRALFLKVFPQVERGDWSAVEALRSDEAESLRDYVLWPDLQAARYRATIRTADHAEVEKFLRDYGTLRPARELRYRYALHLAKADSLAAFLEIYEQFYQGLQISKLDCLALQAEIEADRQHRIVNRAKELWAVGKSQVEECDPVFTHLSENDLFSTTDYMRRFKLAIDAREFSMARWLGKSIDQKHIDIAAQWIRAKRDPEAFVRSHRRRINDASTLEQLVYSIERITYRDPLIALELWNEISARQPFSAEQELKTARHIALWMARDNLPGAYYQLRQLPIAAQNDEVMRWRARTSLRSARWQNLLLDIKQMSEQERDTEEWRYWCAIALARTGQRDAAKQLLANLATEQSYYGFLAADEIGLPYVLETVSVVPDEDAIAELASQPALIRARELFRVGQDGRGRSEWEAVVGFLKPQQKLQAAILAQRWGWHSRAISGAASAGEFDDLKLRYPLPYHEKFHDLSAKAGISPTWAYGVARSESLFMRDVRSRAGAIGLMQLMPETGRKVAREIKLPYSGLDTLTDPDSNIRLGTTYLSQMAERFGGNRVLATAAYNAGPHRVDAWLPDDGTVDARIWIENIPFNETRAYVRRVLAAETIFHYRMTGEKRRLSDQLPEVRANLVASR